MNHLPGTHRDLASMREHVHRAKSSAPLLYACEDLDLHKCDGTTLYSQHAVLDSVRNDICALVSCIHDMEAALREIADAPVTAHSAQSLQRIAKKCVGETDAQT